MLRKTADRSDSHAVSTGYHLLLYDSVSTTNALSNSSPSSMLCTYSTNSTRDRRLTSSAPQLGKHDAFISICPHPIYYCGDCLPANAYVWPTGRLLVHLCLCVSPHICLHLNPNYDYFLTSSTTALFPTHHITTLHSSNTITHYTLLSTHTYVYCFHTSKPTERSASQRDISLSLKSTGFSRDNRSTSLTNSSMLNTVHYGIME